MIKDKRKALRRHMHYTAWLVRDGNALHGCALSDVSETGARIDVEDGNAVPEHFMLLLSGSGSARRKCHVVWRNEHQIGVHFEAGLVPEIDASEQAEDDRP